MIHSQPGLKQRVLAAARQVPSGVRADARSDARTIFLISIVLSLGLFLVFDGLFHAAGPARPPWFVAISVAIWAAVATTSARGAWRWGGSFVPGSALQLTTIALGTPALLLAVSLALARLSPGSVAVGASGGLPCLALTFAAAVYPLTGVCLLRRSTDPLHPIAGGAALGAASGAASGVMVDLWCPITETAHVLSAHVLPVAALTVIGAILGDRVLSMRVRVGRAAIVPGLVGRTRQQAPSDGLLEGPLDAPQWMSPEARKWKEARIAKRFVSCDVTPMGDGVADGRAPSMGVGGRGGAHHDP
jgi:hypothetical protein